MVHSDCALKLVVVWMGGRSYSNNYPWLGAECWNQVLVGAQMGQLILAEVP